MRLNKILLSAGIAVSALFMGGCTGDLDLTPTDPSLFTPDQFAKNPEKYMDQVMAGVYQQFITYGANGEAAVQQADGGQTTFQRSVCILEQFPTDEMSWITSDTSYGGITYGQVATDNTIIMGTYSRFYINVQMCNNFIQTVEDGYFDLPDNLKPKADEYIRQCKILRNAVLYYCLDIFGNAPYADETMRAGDIAPQLSKDYKEGRKMLYEKLVQNFEEIVAWYKQNDPNNKPPRGYVGLDVAESMLVKLYLNAEVYSGTPQWDKCCEHAQAIIDRLGKGGHENSGLCHGYSQNFAYNNYNYCIDGNKNAITEIIWDIPQYVPDAQSDGNGMTSYANATFMVNGWIGSSNDDDPFYINQTLDYNSGNGWKCMVARREFVEKFDWDANYAVSPDKRTKFWKTAKDGFNINNTVLNQANWGSNGYLAVKYSNWYIDDNNEINKDLSPAPTDQLPGDYAMIRLAEIYLSYAEAALQGGGNTGLALQYVNYLRTRAGLDKYTVLNLTELQDERARELYTESTRRTDLIRYGKWISGYTWSWKNRIRNGGDFNPEFEVYPIPAAFCSRNGYVQNPLY